LIFFKKFDIVIYILMYKLGGIYMEFNNELGKVSINPVVVKTIVANVLRESYGVCGLANVSPKDGIYQLLGWDNSSKGVHVVLKENSIFIDLHIVIQYGIKISTVCENIIENVKYNVENLTGLTVKKVNVNVHGIKLEDN
jgi:hypothetical protein